MWEYQAWRSAFL